MAVKISEKWFERRMTFEARRYGVKDMSKVVDLIREVPAGVVFDIFEKEAEKLVKLVVEEIHSQPFWWEPLNKKYKAKKEREGLVTEMLKATEEYVQSIGIQETKKGKESFKIRIGVPNTVHGPSNLNFNTIGRIHELGTKTIPARPHWGPVMKRWERRIPALLMQVRRRVGRKLQKKFEKIFQSETEAKVIK